MYKEITGTDIFLTGYMVPSLLLCAGAKSLTSKRFNPVEVSILPGFERSFNRRSPCHASSWLCVLQGTCFSSFCDPLNPGSWETPTRCPSNPAVPSSPAQESVSLLTAGWRGSLPSRDRGRLDSGATCWVVSVLLGRVMNGCQGGWLQPAGRMMDGSWQGGRAAFVCKKTQEVARSDHWVCTMIPEERGQGERERGAAAARAARVSYLLSHFQEIHSPTPSATCTKEKYSPPIHGCIIMPV